MLYICSRLSLAPKHEAVGRWAYHNAIKNNFHKPNNIMNKSELKPACVFEQFAKVNKIPRPSKHEEKMIEF